MKEDSMNRAHLSNSKAEAVYLQTNQWEDSHNKDNNKMLHNRINKILEAVVISMQELINTAMRMKR
jgi:hypothetical protein